MVSPDKREEIILLAASVLSFGGFWVIAELSRSPGKFAVPVFLLLSLAVMLLSVLTVVSFQRTRRSIPFVWIIVTAIAFRLIAATGEPLFEDDFYRYLWDGYRMATTGDPYSLAPAWFFDADYPEAFDDILSFINYPDVATVYGPMCQWMFALGYLIAPGEVWPLQLLAGLADIGVLCVLRALTRHNALLLYAWCPMLIKEFAMTAHPDIVAILFAMLAVWAWRRDQPVPVGVFLALAVATKVFAILLLPFLLIGKNGLRNALNVTGSFVGVLAMVTWSFGTVNIWLPEGLVAMADSWLFNAPIYTLLVEHLPFQLVKTCLLLLFVAVAGSVFFRAVLKCRQSGIVSKRLRGDWLFGGFLLCMPVVNAWYVPWLLPFAVLYPSRWAWCASVAVLLSYWNAASLGALTTDNAAHLHKLSPLVLAMEYGVIAVAVCFDIRWRGHRSDRYSTEQA